LCTNDGGASCHSSFGGNGCGDEIALAIAPTNTSRAYALTCDASSILRSDNADAPCADVTFRPLTDANYAWSPSPFHWSKHLIAVDPRNADHLAIARGVGVTVSSDGGASATIRALPSNARSVSVLYDDGGVLWVGTTGGIFRSTDDGATFEVVQPDLAAVYALASSPAAGGGQGTIFAGTSDGLFLRRPGGRFHRVLGGGGHIVSEVVVDPSCPSRIYAGFGYSFRSVHRGGVSISTDGGATWSSLSAGAELHNVPITGIQIAPGTQGRLYVSTFGRGAWTFDAEQAASCP
jgi:hypothetical protein